MDPEQQARFNERMQSLSPEERARAMERFAGRGGNAGRGSQQLPNRTIAGSGNAESIDALFAPLQFPETRGRVWLRVNGQLQAVPVRLGITDGTNTELIQDASAALQIGQEVVTAVNIGTAAQSAAGRSPLMPGGMGGRGGGPMPMPGGGGGRR